MDYELLQFYKTKLSVDSVKAAKEVKLKKFTKHDRVTLYWPDETKSIFRLGYKLKDMPDQELMKIIQSKTSYKCSKCGSRVWEKIGETEGGPIRSHEFKCVKCGFVDTIHQFIFPEKKGEQNGS